MNRYRPNSMHLFLQFLAGQERVSFLVLRNGLVDDILRQLVVAVRVCLEPVTNELLVVRRLGFAHFVAFQRPETGAVRCQHFVCQNDFAVLVQSELELGIGNDDAVFPCVVRALLVYGDGEIPNFGSVLFAVSRIISLQNFDALLVGDVLIVIADFSLGARSEDRLRQLLGLLQSFRQLESPNLAGFKISCPTASGDVSANDALQREHLQLAAHHAAAFEFLVPEEFRHIIHIC